MAVYNACKKLKKRLDKLKEKINKENIEFKELVLLAYENTINLSAQGFYQISDQEIYFDYEKKIGKPYNFFN
jgi:xanthine dehydrogenase molybdopterin-binding subunit B